MIYEKISYHDDYHRKHRQVYAVGVRRSINDTLEIIAEFSDVKADGYDASREADRLMAQMESCDDNYGA